jgi:hypothetical protein
MNSSSGSGGFRHMTVLIEAGTLNSALMAGRARAKTVSSPAKPEQRQS